VYWDANGNGAQDTGERGIHTRVDLLDDGGATVGSGEADTAGDYRIEIAPGTYRAKPYVYRRIGMCADTLMATNSPFPAGGCYAAEFPVTSPETSDAFTIAAGATRRDDFGVTAKDQMVIIAQAVEEGGYAPPGSTVTARVRGKACGSVVVPGEPGSAERAATFVLYVEGAGSVSGCAAPGDTVEFEMNGRTASETVTYARFVPGPTAWSLYYAGGVAFVDMAFAKDWMWIWSDNLAFPDSRPVPAGAWIVARIGQAGCGLGVNTSDVNAGGSIGFARLLVPSERISIGCGKAGAQVDLVAILPDRDEAIASFPWKPGVKQIGPAGVAPPPAPTAVATREVSLPNTGTGDGTPRSDFNEAWAIALASLLAGAGAAAARTLTRR
jgi:hypothetical protein